ncbi:ABC transporter permease [bacterium]|nr:ABC transporter permease [bacterium]
MRKKFLTNTSFFVPALTFTFYVIIALGAFLGIWANDFDLINYQQSYLPPSMDFLFGTDLFGRSVLQRSFHATKIALLVGFVSTLISLLIGVLLGAIGGYFRGWVDEIIVWFYTTLDSIPYILLLAAFAFALGQGLQNIFWALGLTTWTTLCKIVRGEFIKLKNAEFVLAARAQGSPTWKIIFCEILPNTAHLIFVQAGVVFVSVIKIEVILSYLGLGLEPGSPSWGLMINDAKQEITRGIWWNMFAATLFMFGLVLSAQLLLEALRKHWDPKES